VALHHLCCKQLTLPQHLYPLAYHKWFHHRQLINGVVAMWNNLASPSTEDIQESAEAALAATSQGI
jgi:hypothetical protein